MAHCPPIQMDRDEQHETGVPKLLLLVVETLQPRHSTEGAIDAIEMLA